MQLDRSKSLEALESTNWGNAAFDSHLVTECHRLRRVPLQNLGVEDLRIMIGQNIGLEYLIPLALERLRDDALAEGDYYLGDLLVAVLHAGTAFWQGNSDLREEVALIANRAAAMPDAPEETVAACEGFLMSARSQPSEDRTHRP